MAKRTPTGEFLKLHSDHFMHYDWNYTRKHNIDKLYYSYELSRGYDKPINRFKRALKWLFGPTPEFVKYLDRDLSWFSKISNRWGMFTYVLKRDNALPDGSLADGKIIVHWEEDGEYLQLVQPSVGSLLADFLTEEPEHPHAQKIIKEIERIRKAYTKRVKNGDVCDCGSCKAPDTKVTVDKPTES